MRLCGIAFSMGLVAATMLMMVGGTGYAQELGRGKTPVLKSTDNYLFYVNSRGNFVKFLLAKSRPVYQLKRIQFLNDPAIAEQLELVETQRRRISGMMDDIRDYNRRLYTDAGTFREVVSKRDAHGAESLRDSVDVRLKKMLLPHQREQIDRLMLRHQIISSGLIAAVKQLQEQGRLEVSFKEIKAFERAVEALQPDVNRQVNEKIASFYRDIIDSLEASQQTQLKQVIRDCESIMSPSLELMVLLLDSNATQELDQEAGRDEFREIQVGRLFRLSPSGALFEVDQIGGLACPAESVIADCLSGKFGELELMESQRLALSKLSPEDQEQLREFEERNAEFARRVKSESKEALKRESRELILEVSQWKWNRFKKVLIDSQIEQLDDIIIRRAIAQRGIVACMLDGQLASRLAITEEQREEIRGKAAKFREELIRFSHKLESQILRRVTADINHDAAMQLRDWIESTDPKIAACPQILLSRAAN